MSRDRCEATCRSHPCRSGRGQCSGLVAPGAATRCARGTTRWDCRAAARWGSPSPTSTYAISLPPTRRRCFWYGNAAEIMLPSPSFFVGAARATTRPSPRVSGYYLSATETVSPATWFPQGRGRVFGHCAFLLLLERGAVGGRQKVRSREVLVRTHKHGDRWRT